MRPMQERRGTWILAAVGLLSAGCPAGPADTDELRIASPHRDEIQYEFGRAFGEAYRAATGRPATLIWLDVGGGTGAIFRYLGQYRDDPGASGIDVVFGGGTEEYLRFAGEGFFEPYRLPEAILQKIPPELGGVPCYDPQYRWYGATLSSFGVVYNRVVCARQGLPVPRTWRDLADRRLEGWVSSGDPRLSGVVHQLAEIVLQAYGWREGWKVLVLTAANSRGFTRGSGEPVREVTTGEVALAGCIDFYALSAIAREGPERVGYVAPEGATPIGADSIAIVRGARHPAVARRFLEFVMSEAGQRLWILKPGQPQGPHRYALGRLPVMPHLYEQPGGEAVVSANPFQMPLPMRLDFQRGSRRRRILDDLYGAAIIQAHDDLVAAWRAVIRAGCPEPLVAPLSEPPCAESELDRLTDASRDPRRRAALMRQWLDEARARYREVARLARASAGSGT